MHEKEIVYHNIYVLLVTVLEKEEGRRDYILNSPCFSNEIFISLGKL